MQKVNNKRLNFMVLLLGILAFLAQGDNYAAAPMIIEIAKDLNIELSQAAISVTVYMLPFGLFTLLYGPLGDKIGKAKVLKVCAFLTAVFSGLGAVVSNLPSLITIRALNGMFAAGTFPVTMALVGDFYGNDPKKVQNALGRVMGMMFLGGAIAPAIGGLLSYFGSWRLVYLTYGVAELIVAAIIFGVVHESESVMQKAVVGGNPYKSAFSNKLLIGITSLLILVGFAALGSFTYTGDYIQSKTGYNILIIGLILSCYGVGTVLGGRNSGTVRQRIGNKALLFAGLIGGIVWSFMGLWNHTTLYCLSLFIFGLCFIMIQPTLVASAQQLVPRQRGLAMSLSSFCMMLGGAIGTAVNGRVIEHAGYVYVYIGASVALLVAGILATLLLNKIHVSVHQPASTQQDRSETGGINRDEKKQV